MRHVGGAWAVAGWGILLMALACVGADAGGAGETTAVREVSGFESVSLGTNGRLIVTQGDREALEIVAAGRELARIVTEVRDGTLYIGRDASGLDFALRPPTFRLTVKSLTALATRSSGEIRAAELRAASLRIQVSSSGGISIDSLAADSLEVEITSSGSVRVAGRVAEQDVRLTSSGSYSARDLASRTARVRVSSSGSATLRVSESLVASVTSSGNVRYYGSPQVDGNVTSSGRLVRAGD